MNYLIKFSILIFIIISNNLYGKENIDNKVIFKLNNKIFTEIDLEERIKYHEITNNFNIDEYEKEEIFEDYVSSLIFYEYSIENNITYIDFKKQIADIFQKNFKSLELTEYESEFIIKNLKYDLTRKKIVEDILNSKREILNKKTNTLDLLYNYNLSYIIINNDNLKKIDFKIENLNARSDFIKLTEHLKFNNIDYIFKTTDILDSTIISNFIKQMIKKNKKIDFNIKNNYTEIFSLEKDLESYDGIFVKLINYKSKIKLNKNKSNCNFINNKDNKINFKEYEYTKLNENVKKNLKSVNDYFYFKNEDAYNYVFLCELRFNEEILNNININKKINFLAEDIQKKFINKYKKIYNYNSK